MQDVPWNLKTHLYGILLAVITLTYCLISSYSVFSSLVLVLCALYLPPFFDGTEYTATGRTWVWFRRLELWRHLVGGISLKIEEPLDSNRQAIFAAFPHGICSLSHIAMVTDAAGWISGGHYIRDRRNLGANVVFKIPFYRDFMLWLGIVDAGIKTARKVLDSGRALYVLPGGEMEQMLTIEGQHRVFINNRKGFVRLAVEYGIDLIPIYTFGETDLYHTSDFLLDFRIWICKKFRVAIPLFWSYRWGFPIPFLSKPVHLTLCMGKPIPVRKISHSSEEFSEYVNVIHKQFIEALVVLFDKYKLECGYPKAVLELL